MTCIVSDFLSENFFPGFKITNISFSEVSDKDISKSLRDCCSAIESTSFRKEYFSSFFIAVSMAEVWL